LDSLSNLTVTTVTVSSDARLKGEVREISGSLDLIGRLRPVTWAWNDHPANGARTGRHGIGFIAQEMETVMPGAVRTDAATGLKSVNYDAVIAPLVASVQELRAMNDNLLSGLNELKAANDELQSSQRDLRIVVGASVIFGFLGVGIVSIRWVFRRRLAAIASKS
jgi:hypothetical protein